MSLDSAFSCLMRRCAWGMSDAAARTIAPRLPLCKLLPANPAVEAFVAKTAAARAELAGAWERLDSHAAPAVSPTAGETPWLCCCAPRVEGKWPPAAEELRDCV